MSFSTFAAVRNGALAALLLTGFCSGAMAAEQERAVMQSPAKDAAMVAKLSGLVNNHKAKTLTGQPRTVNDGVVIRKSSIRDGKIVIPPSGLYVTVRSTNWHPFDSEPIMLAGKPYFAITDAYTQDVVRNVTMKLNQIVPSNANKSRGWQLTALDPSPYGIKGAYSAVFKILKTTGNYYGDDFPVYQGPMISNSAADGTLAKGSKLAEGHTVPTAANKISEVINGTNVATVGRSFVVVDEITPTEVKVRELTTDSNSTLWVSPTEPVVGQYAKGDKFKVGSTDVEVTAVTPNSATVTLKDSAGVVTKTFGPLTAENTNWTPMSMSQRELFWTPSKKGDAIVHLNINAADPIADGKVKLVAFTDVLALSDGNAWPSDPRFLARPET